MKSVLKTGNGLLLTLLGTLGSVASLWLPWLNFTAETWTQQKTLRKVTAALSDVLKPFDKVQRGLDGVVDVGAEVPVWVFIGLIALIGVISLLRISRILPTSVWIAHLLLLISASACIYWVAGSMSDGAQLLAGAVVGLVGAVLILVGNVVTGKS